MRKLLKLRYLVTLAVPLAIGLTAVTAFADSSPSPNPSGSPSSAAVGDPSNGQTLFGANCASCHGASATGGIGPSLNPIVKLNGVANPVDPQYLIDTITNGRKASDGFNSDMPAKGGNSSLTEQDIRDLAAYIIQLNQQTGPRPYDEETLPKMTMLWVAIGIIAFLVMTWLLATYNMRWIARRARRQ